jgi:hypothetical protein
MDWGALTHPITTGPGMPGSLRIGRLTLVEAWAENRRLKFQLCGRNRAAEQIALRKVDAERFQPVELLAGFHAFRRHRHVEAARQRHGR